MSDKQLTNKQRVFIEEYLQCWNATEAARQAGYKNPRQMGSENLSKPDISEGIKARLSEKVMSANEVLERLSEQARGDVGDFAGVVLTPKDAGDHPQSHLIQRLKTRGHRNKDGTVTVTTQIEIYNAQTALQLIGKHYGLFVDKVEHSGTVPITVKVIKGVSVDDL